MLIRSQDKTALVKFENIVVNLKLPDSLNIICWSLQDAHDILFWENIPPRKKP